MRTPLADVLDDDESGQADTLPIEEVLIDTARVDADTPLLEFIVVVSLFAFSADTIDGVESSSAIAVFGGEIEYLVDTASIAFGLEAVLYFDGRSAVDTVLCVGEDC